MANDNTRRRRRSPAAAGDGLYKDHLSGIYQWRGTDPRDGKRIKRSTGCRRRDLARRKAAQFEEELERRSVGLEDLSDFEDLPKAFFPQTSPSPTPAPTRFPVTGQTQHALRARWPKPVGNCSSASLRSDIVSV